VDLEEQTVLVDPPEGLLELADPPKPATADS
jgi:hypothetical protein